MNASHSILNMELRYCEDCPEFCPDEALACGLAELTPLHNTESIIVKDAPIFSPFFA
jgi:hypothetical protein